MVYPPGVEEHVLGEHGHIVEDGITTMYLGTSHPKHTYVYTPAGLPDIAEGRRLQVLHQFVSDARCPFGAGKLCLLLEAGYMAVFTGTPAGIAWLRQPLPPVETNIVPPPRRSRHRARA